MEKTGNGHRFGMRLAPLLVAAALFLFVSRGTSAPIRHDSRQTPQESMKTTSPSPEEQELLKLSKDKWLWMAERKVDSLDALFHEKAVFVHMGATMTKEQELDTIRGGGIQYKSAEIQEASVRFIGDTAILLNRIRLVAVVGGNEVVNPFVVTEVYVKVDGAWKLGSLSFTKTLG